MPKVPRRLVVSLAAVATALLVAVVPIGREAVLLTLVAAQPATTPITSTAAVTTSTVSSIGVAYVPASTQSIQTQAVTLNLSVQERIASAEVRSGLQTVRAKLEALTTALGRVGISPSAVHIGTIGFTPFYGPAPGTPAGSPQSIQGYVITENMQVDVSGVEQLADAVQVGVEAGATSMNINPRGGPQIGVAPDPATVAPAIARATGDAKTLALAVAQSAGVRLGGIQSMSVAPPQLTYVGPTLSAWRVQVTVTYAIAASSP